MRLEASNDASSSHSCSIFCSYLLCQTCVFVRTFTGQLGQPPQFFKSHGLSPSTFQIFPVVDGHKFEINRSFSMWNKLLRPAAGSHEFAASSHRGEGHPWPNSLRYLSGVDDLKQFDSKWDIDMEWYGYRYGYDRISQHITTRIWRGCNLRYH
jgi:hypothetical protein